MYSQGPQAFYFYLTNPESAFCYFWTCFCPQHMIHKQMHPIKDSTGHNALVDVLLHRTCSLQTHQWTPPPATRSQGRRTAAPWTVPLSFSNEQSFIDTRAVPLLLVCVNALGLGFILPGLSSEILHSVCFMIWNWICFVTVHVCGLCTNLKKHSLFKITMFTSSVYLENISGFAKGQRK